MKIGLINREKLYALGQSLVDELDSLVARIRASWNIEHTPEGSHSHVHAQTVTTGRLTFSDIVVPEALVVEEIHNFNPAGLNTAALLRLGVFGPFSEVRITGLQVPLDEAGNVIDGRVLVIENNDATSTLALEHEHTGSLPRNRFTVPHAPTSESVYARFLLHPRSLVMLVYNATRARWEIQSQSNDQVVSYNEISTSQNNYAPDEFRASRVVRLVATAPGLSISGFNVGAGSGSGAAPIPFRKTIINEGSYAISFLHASTLSDEANRIYCPGGVRYKLNPRESVELYREVDGTMWIAGSGKADQWADVPFDAALFTASGAGTWTVASGNVTTLAYQIDGNKMTVSFFIVGTNVSGAPEELRITIPDGRIAARSMRNSIPAVSDAGTGLSTGQAAVAAGTTYISIFKDVTGSAWTNTASSNTNVVGQITFMVQDDSAGIDELHTDVAHGDTAHADAEHSDVAHVDTAHGDTHTDTAHADGFHGDIAHVDVAHSDTPHSDTAHADSHSDVSHEDVSHEDVSHEDTPHADTQHEDVSHEDIAHSDFGENVLGLHQDSINPHVDHIDDPFVPHYDHDDGPHLDTAHEDVGHADTAHTDTAHEDVSHEDVAHEDVAHEDVAHSDTAHSDTAHADSHTDSTHSDTAHGDSHLDSPHLDTAHTDQSHGDTVHADSAHGDVGYHTDTAHTDQ